MKDLTKLCGAPEAAIVDAFNRLAVAGRKNRREARRAGLEYRRNVASFPTVQDFLAADEAVRERFGPLSGTRKERAELKAKVSDGSATDHEAREHDRMDEAHAILNLASVYKNTVARVVCRVLDYTPPETKRGPSWSTAFNVVEGEGWTSVREHFARFPNMTRALDWTKHGGDVENPNREPKKTRAPKGDDTPAVPADDIVEAVVALVTANLDETAGEAARLAMTPIVAGARERIARKAD